METRLLIAGEQVAGEGPGLDVENPYTHATVATVALPSFEQVDAAIGAARAAARGWADTPAVERCELLHEGLEAFQETKHVHIETKIAAKSWWYPYGASA